MTSSRFESAHRKIDGLSAIGVFGLVFLPIWIAYLATANYGYPQMWDTYAAAVPAWQFATHGDFTLDQFADATCSEEVDTNCVPWFIERNGRLVSNRPPGVVFFAVPFYWAGSPDPTYRGLYPPMAPAAVAAATAAALAVGILAVGFRKLTANSQAVAAALVFGLGTATWSVSADALYQHGPNQLWLAAAMLLVSMERYATSGLMYGAAMFTRGTTGIAAAVTGIYLSWRRRSVRPALLIGLISALGLAGLLWYNAVMFSTASPVGGYGDYVVESLLRSRPLDYAKNLFAMLFNRERGLLLWSPFLLALLPGLPSAWKIAPPWVRAAALSGIGYLLLQARINSFTGGNVFFSYRLSLEAVTLAAPLLLLSWKTWASKTERRRLITGGLVALSFVFHALGATALSQGLSRPPGA